MADKSDGKANPVKEVFEELFSLLENLETQNAAVMAFLKDQGIATDEKLAPYLEQAGNAASVRWRAARVRMNHLFSPIPAALLDREPTKSTPNEKDASSKAAEENEKSQSSEAKNAEEKTAQSKAEHTNPPADKAAVSTKDQAGSQQSTEPQNADQSQAKEKKESNSGDTEIRKPPPPQPPSQLPEIQSAQAQSPRTRAPKRNKPKQINQPNWVNCLNRFHESR